MYRAPLVSAFSMFTLYSSHNYFRPSRHLRKIKNLLHHPYLNRYRVFRAFLYVGHRRSGSFATNFVAAPRQVEIQKQPLLQLPGNFKYQGKLCRISRNYNLGSK